MNHELPKVWSDNLLSLYIETNSRLRGDLVAAVEFLDRAQVGLLFKTMNSANGYIATMTKCLESANLTVIRVQALADEVKALRSGVGVSYAEGADPTQNISDHLNGPFRGPA